MAEEIDLTDEDDGILDEVWDQIGEKDGKMGKADRSEVETKDEDND